MAEEVESPFTGEKARRLIGAEIDFGGIAYDDPYGRIYLTEGLARTFGDGSLLRTFQAYEPRDLEKAWALLRSRYWRLARNEGKGCILVMRAEDANWWNEWQIRHDNWGRHVVAYTIEELILQAKNLTFGDKQVETLRNLVELWLTDGKIPVSDWWSGVEVEGRRRPKFKEGTPPIPPYVYGATQREWPLLMEALYADGFISVPIQNTS